MQTLLTARAFALTAQSCNGPLRVIPAETSSSEAEGDEGDALKQIVVMAQRSTPELARAAHKQGDNLMSITTAEEMQRLPDVNTGEAI